MKTIVIIFSYPNFLNLVLVLQERNHGLQLSNKKKILNFVYLNRLQRQFSLYRCSLPFHDYILICHLHDHVSCAGTRNQFISHLLATFIFTLCFVWYEDQSIWFYNITLYGLSYGAFFNLSLAIFFLRSS